ncbi:MAG: hypothetical protein ACI9ZF_003723, partial [Bradyrhizobium sp.]
GERFRTGSFLCHGRGKNSNLLQCLRHGCTQLIQYCNGILSLGQEPLRESRQPVQVG